jgi:DNA processing protein
MSVSADRLARASLSLIGEPGDLRLTHLVHQIGAEEVWEGLVKQRERDELRGDLSARISAMDATTMLAGAARQGIRFLTPTDDEWPQRLEDLAFAPALNERGGVPIGLWVRGRHRLNEIVEKSVSIVGSRSATTYGAEVTRQLAMELAKVGQASVSGAAYGIDQAAHRGSLIAGGLSVALLSCGVDRPYPTAHKELLDWIADNGAVVSEAPPGGAPTRIRFLSRNRLIAALGSGVVVVEAALRSGALNTANWGLGLGREVMGVPGPITSAPSSGVHQLIRTKGATLVTSAEEVLEVVSHMGQHMLSFPREEPTQRDLLTTAQKVVLDAVPVQTPVVSERIARAAGFSRKKTEDALRQLHQIGLVLHHEGQWRLAPH